MSTDKASHTPAPLTRTDIARLYREATGATRMSEIDEDFARRVERAAIEACAAPDMLAALRESLAALEWAVEQGGGPVCEHESGGAVCFCKENNAISSARAAIAKAEQP